MFFFITYVISYGRSTDFDCILAVNVNYCVEIWIFYYFTFLMNTPCVYDNKIKIKTKSMLKITTYVN